MTPMEAFKRAMFFISGLCSQRMLNVPGAIINRLSTKEREALSQLKSSDIDGSPNTERVEYLVGSDQFYQNKEFEKDKLDFDKKILQNELGPRFRKYDS